MARIASRCVDMRAGCSSPNLLALLAPGVTWLGRYSRAEQLNGVTKHPATLLRKAINIRFHCMKADASQALHLLSDRVVQQV